jgi:hypothetical protein
MIDQLELSNIEVVELWKQEMALLIRTIAVTSGFGRAKRPMLIKAEGSQWKIKPR